jgi:hypothetical protein
MHSLPNFFPSLSKFKFMKSFLKKTIFSGLAVASISTTAFAVETLNGDLYACFYQINSSTGAVERNTYFFRMGPAAAYRENTQNNILISSVTGGGVSNANINADLVSAFGSNWANDGTVRWCIVGGNDQTTSGLLNGELQGSSYVSRSIGNFTNSGLASTTVPAAAASGARNLLRNSIEAVRFYHNGRPSELLTGLQTTNNPNGLFAITLSGAAATIDSYLPPFTTAQFGIPQNVLQIFEPGIVPGSTSLEGALDIWRLVNASSSAALLTSGTDLTSGFGTGNAVLGTGQFCGTITLDSLGNLRVGGTSTVVAGNYASWAMTNNVSGGPNGDSDNDGVSNLVEYALNLNLTGSDGANATGNLNGGLITFNKRAEAVTNGDVLYGIETSENLAIWTPATATSNTATLINYTIPAGSPKKFARLKLTVTP